MSTRKERVSSSFNIICSSIKTGSIAKAHTMLINIVEREVKKALSDKK